MSRLCLSSLLWWSLAGWLSFSRFFVSVWHLWNAWFDHLANKAKRTHYISVHDICHVSPFCCFMFSGRLEALCPPGITGRLIECKGRPGYRHDDSGIVAFSRWSKEVGHMSGSQTGQATGIVFRLPWQPSVQITVSTCQTGNRPQNISKEDPTNFVAIASWRTTRWVRVPSSVN